MALLRSDDEGRGEKDVIATQAVYRTLGGIGEDVFFKGGLADFFGDGGFFRERLARGFVFDEFDGLQEAEAAHLADLGMGFESGEGFAERVASSRDAIEEFMGFEVIEDGVAGCGGDGMRLVGEAVHEGGGAFFEGVNDSRRDEDRAERGVATGDSLPGENDVGLEVPVLAGERFAYAAHAGHDFVGDEENAVAAADFGDAGSVAVDGGRGTERGADDGFEDEGGDGGGVVGTEKNFEIIGAGEIAFGIGFAERAVITEAGSDVAPFGDHRRVRRAAADVAADGHGAESAAVIALPAGNDAVTRRLFAFEKILADELDGGFGGFGAAGGEVDAAAIVKIARSDGDDAGGKFFCGFGVELRGVGKGDATRLLGHGAADLGDTVADADDGGLAGGIEIAAAVGGDDPAAFTADGDGIIFAKIAGKERGGMESGAHLKIVAEAAERRVEAGTGERAKLDGTGEGVGYSFAGLEAEIC